MWRRETHAHAYGARRRTTHEWRKEETTMRREAGTARDDWSDARSVTITCTDQNGRNATDASLVLVRSRPIGGDDSGSGGNERHPQFFQNRIYTRPYLSFSLSLPLFASFSLSLRLSICRTVLLSYHKAYFVIKITGKIQFSHQRQYFPPIKPVSSTSVVTSIVETHA